MSVEHSLVALKADRLEHGLHGGDVGTVVFVHNDGEAFEVEFVDNDGATVALLTLKADEVRLVEAATVPASASGWSARLVLVLLIAACLGAAAFLAVHLATDLATDPATDPHGGDAIRTETPPAAVVLAAARLAPLPIDATDVTTRRWRGVFTGESFLAFTAAPGSIDDWLQRCRAIRPLAVAEKQSYEKSDFAPDWFIDAPGCETDLYEIPRHGDHNWGHLLIDRPTGRVYVCIIFS